MLDHGFTQYVQPPQASSDPVDDLRQGWDRHVRFGLDHPHLLRAAVRPDRARQALRHHGPRTRHAA
ncbi:hypothetical protein [Nonomuraea rubra]|uniref:hypothetical protein n=1 Tax=Nonomuraea rubra TaxID=46180 RepID=UPI0031E5947D